MAEWSTSNADSSALEIHLAFSFESTNKEKRPPALKREAFYICSNSITQTYLFQGSLHPPPRLLQPVVQGAGVMTTGAGG